MVNVTEIDNQLNDLTEQVASRDNSSKLIIGVLLFSLLVHVGLVIRFAEVYQKFSKERQSVDEVSYQITLKTIEEKSGKEQPKHDTVAEVTEPEKTFEMPPPPEDEPHNPISQNKSEGYCLTSAFPFNGKRSHALARSFALKLLYCRPDYLCRDGPIYFLNIT